MRLLGSSGGGAATLGGGDAEELVFKGLLHTPAKKNTSTILTITAAAPFW